MTEKLFTGTLNHNQNKKTKQINICLFTLEFNPTVVKLVKNHFHRKAVCISICVFNLEINLTANHIAVKLVKDVYAKE